MNEAKPEISFSKTASVSPSMIKSESLNNEEAPISCSQIHSESENVSQSNMSNSVEEEEGDSEDNQAEIKSQSSSKLMDC